MEFIFTPWRYEYVSNVDNNEGCIFCDKIGEDNDRENLIVYRAEKCFAILNLYPYSTGHLMVAPYEHTGSIEDVDGEILSDIMATAKKGMSSLRKTLNPDGFNIGINIQRVAGAGITDHVHMHVVPRWAGDSNFMTVCSDTRVLPMSLDQVWEKLTGFH
jgi:ATP adenylyltransferase